MAENIRANFKLRPRQMIFLNEFLKDGDAIRSAKVAGYKDPWCIAYHQLKKSKPMRLALAEASAPIPLAYPRLSDRQRIFVDRYLEHGNKVQAAIEAGYSKINASSIALDILKNNKRVRARLKLLRPDLEDFLNV